MNAKEKILDSAYKLFCEYGYEKTSVQKIVDASGTSKGGFYHHFESKEEVVEAIAHDFVKVLEIKQKSMIEDPSKSIYSRINSIYQDVIEYKKTMIVDWPGLAKMLSFEGNIRVIQSMAKHFEMLTTNAYLALIEQGIHEKLFFTEFPKQVASLFAREMIQVYGDITNAIMSDDQTVYKQFVENLEFTQIVLNRALNLNEHKILIKEETLKYLEYVKQNYKNEVIK